MYTNGRIDFDDMTDYDKYMMRKNINASIYNVPQKSKLSNKKNSKVAFRQPEDPNRDSKLRPMDYRTYLLLQLERKEPSTILSEEEFNLKRLEEESLDSENKVKYACVRENGFYDSIKRSVKSFFNKKVVADKKMKTGSKVFIASYVLIVVAVASTILVVNAKKTVVPNDSLVSADNSHYEQVDESVSPMSLEENETESQNWFDKLLDAMKK